MPKLPEGAVVSARDALNVLDLALVSWRGEARVSRRGSVGQRTASEVARVLVGVRSELYRLAARKGAV